MVEDEEASGTDLVRLAKLARILLLALLAWAAGLLPATAQPLRPFDHVFIIIMGEGGFDQIIGSRGLVAGQPLKVALTPFITELAENMGLGTLYFGVTHPSLPNYLALLAGDTFGIRDENDSCAAQPEPSRLPCHLIDAPTIVDQLEQRGLSWLALEQSMPMAGFLGDQYPGFAPRLYAQAHNPFVYFKGIARNSGQLGRIQPFSFQDFAHRVSAPALANLVFIVPDQCHDMRGTTICSDKGSLLQSADQFLNDVVGTIRGSKSWGPRSIIFVTWVDSGDDSETGCCQSPPQGGGHVPFLVITQQGTIRQRSALALNHYSLLRTVEDIFGLDHLGMAAKVEPIPNALWR